MFILTHKWSGLSRYYKVSSRLPTGWF